MKRLLFALLFLLAACAPKQEPSPGVAKSADLNSLQITVKLAAQGNITPIHFGATVYHSVSRDWLSQTVYPSYLHELSKVGLFKDGHPRYDNRAQCNYFADKVVVVAQEQFFVDQFHSASTTESPAVGVVWYLMGADPTKAHAINIAILDDSSLVFFDPQGGVYQEVKLSQAEIHSIFFARF